MGISLGGLLTAGGNALAAKNQAAAQGLAQQRQAMLQMLALQMQQRALERQNALAQSTIGKNAAQGDLARARVKALANPQTPLSYQTDKDGNIVGLPTRVSAGQTPAPVQTGVKGQPKAPVMGSPDWLKAQEEQAKIRAKYAKEPGVFVVNPSDPNSTPIYTPRSKAFGMGERTPSANQSAVAVSQNARLQSAVSEMNNAHASMSDYEHKLATGQAHITAPSQVLSRIANTFTHDDPVSQAAQSAALSALNQSDPELARYIRRGLSFAEGESLISQRPSDFRTRMAAFLSTAASGASPEMIQDIESRRNSILNPLNDVVGDLKPHHAAPQGNATGNINLAAPSAKVPTYEEWLAKHGHKP